MLKPDYWLVLGILRCHHMSNALLTLWCPIVHSTSKGSLADDWHQSKSQYTHSLGGAGRASTISMGIIRCHKSLQGTEDQVFRDWCVCTQHTLSLIIKPAVCVYLEHIQFTSVATVGWQRTETSTWSMWCVSVCVMQCAHSTITTSCIYFKFPSHRDCLGLRV